MREALPKVCGQSTIAYTGPSDIRYGILTIAAIKTGFKVWPKSLVYLLLIAPKRRVAISAIPS
jgi:hypothetical protein